ncbi:uncharacterized protein P884DRAFT_292789 [Thermothelomyces heterothallicus CBS 202.75]|uniref:uncharacterized protein n=1 Tax=Thermothelomyces heterothallicus CBS 202.75 TaxID=1149848 RepID=UPI003742F3CA
MMGDSVGFRKSLASLSAPYQSGSDWARVREDAIALPLAAGRKGVKGPRSLVAMCCRVLADNLGAVSKSSIEHLPDHLLWKLWKTLGPRNRSLHAWNILSCVLLEGSQQRCVSEGGMKSDQSPIPMALFRYRQEIIDPPCDLAVYVSPLARLEKGSLAYLCLDNVARFQTHELITLATLQPLAVLEIIERDDADSKVSDALIRGWSEAGKDPFSRLRVLKIASKTHRISESGLQYLLKLPCLEIIDITALPTTKLRLSRRMKDTLDTSGWRVARPRGSLFVSYADAFLDGRVAVHPAGVEALKMVFEDDRQPVIWVDNTRAAVYKQWERGAGRGTGEWNGQPVRTSYGDESYDGPDPASDCRQPRPTDFSDVQYLDDGWRAVLQGFRSSTTKDTQEHSSTRDEERLDDQIFWFLALMDQSRYDGSNAVRGCASGVTLPLERLVCLRLRNPCNTAVQTRLLLNSERLIFSRRRMHAVLGSRSEIARCQLESEDGQSCDLSPSGASRTDDRRQGGLEPRKRQNSEAERLSHPLPSRTPGLDDRREKGLQPRKRLKKPLGEILNPLMEPQVRPG